MSTTTHDRLLEGPLTHAESHRPDLHSGGFRALIDVAREVLGEARLDALLTQLGVGAAELEDRNAWFSLYFAEALIDGLVRVSGDPLLIDTIARRQLQPAYLGAMYPIYRALGTPMSAYVFVGTSARRTNRTGEHSCKVIGPGHVEISFRLHEGMVERTPWICRMREVWLGLGPTLFDLPPARVTHDVCMQRGAPACVYDVQWEDRPRPLWPFMLASATALVCGAGASALGLPFLADLVITMFAGVTVLALCRNVALRSELGERIQDMQDLRSALTRSELAAEQRYDELLEAKSEVERKVELRTSELRVTGAELAKTLETVRAQERAKTELFNNVSHELRTPLTLILAPLDDLVAGREPPGGRALALAAMRRNAERLLHLINQVLDLAKVDAGEVRLYRAQTDLAALARSVVATFEAAANTRKVALSLEADPKLEPLALDRSWIETALINLVANALRFVNAGGHVKLRIEDLGERVCLSVEDDETGMDAHDAARVFERFSQAGDTGGDHKGTGLGLSIVREAAHLHGGEVSLRTQKGEGSTFTLSLPRQHERQLDLPNAAGPISFSPPSGMAEAELRELGVAEHAHDSLLLGPIGAPTALVIDDNPDLRAHVANVLASRYRVTALADGREGLVAARALVPDVIVSDVAMPELDGLSLLRELRADERLRDIPVLLVTARSNVAHVVEGFAAGASDYLVKPFHATELLARVNVHVNLRRMSGQLARKERLAALGSIAAAVAHQVRNPLSALISGLPAMRGRIDAQLDTSSKEMFDIMLECASRIDRMTHDLLALARIDRESSGLVLPGQGLLSAVRILTSRAIEHVEVQTEVETQATLEGRAGQLNHVFIILLDNALRAVASAPSDGAHATEQGSEHEGPSGNGARIRVTGKVQDGCYVATIEDSGRGVEPALRERIFEPFFSLRPAGEGSGLGLAIARQIVEEHGGTLGCEASSLGGAAFVVRLPRVKAASSA